MAEVRLTDAELAAVMRMVTIFLAQVSPNVPLSSRQVVALNTLIIALPKTLSPVDSALITGARIKLEGA